MVLDIITSILSNFALNLVDGSIWQLTRGGEIITTALLSKLLLKRIFTHRELLGCSLVFIGITLVQVVSIMAEHTESDDQGRQSVLGVVLLLFALLCNSSCLILEKDIFNKYEIEPMRMVYLQGFMGVAIMLVVTFLFQYVPCPWSDLSQCVCLSPS